MKRIAIFLAALACGLAAPAPASADISPTATYCADNSLRGKSTRAPDNDYSAWWNWYEANYSTNLVSTVSYTSSRPHDHQVRITYKISTNTTGYFVYAKFTCYWTPTSPAHGGGTYIDVNDMGFGPATVP